MLLLSKKVSEQADCTLEKLDMPSHKIVNMNTISEDDINSELEKGYKDMIEGQTKPAKDAFDKKRLQFPV